MLFLHGYLSCKESFYYQIDYFSNYYEVIAPDFIGFGKSSPLSKAYSVDDYARWLAKFLSREQIKTPDIVCHSFGARVIIKAVANGYVSANAIVITGGAGIVKKRSARYKVKVGLYRSIKKFMPKFAEKRFGSKEYRSLSPLMKESYKQIVNEDLSDCARKIKNRTLLIYGNQDDVTPFYEEGEAFNGLIKNSRLCVMQGGHFCFCEHYELFNKTVRGFLTE